MEYQNKPKFKRINLIRGFMELKPIKDPLF